MSRLRVAAAQLAVRDSRAAIVEDHLACIGQARAAGADLLLFPELSLTGYAGAVEAWRSDALPDAALLRQFADAAGPVAVAIGLPEEVGAGQVCNAQVVLRAGKVVHRHRKLCLPTYGSLEEGKHFTPGHVLQSFQLGSWRVAILTCADLWNPALPWLAALDGVTLLLVPVASAAGAVDEAFDTPAGWDVVLRHTSLLYGLPVAMANYASSPFWGGSRIIDALGGITAQAGAEPELLVAGLDMAQVRAARRLLPTRRDSNPELVSRELGRRLDAANRSGPELAPLFHGVEGHGPREASAIGQR